MTKRKCKTWIASGFLPKLGSPSMELVEKLCASGPDIEGEGGGGECRFGGSGR